jgi:dihydropteroate synthase
LITTFSTISMKKNLAHFARSGSLLEACGRRISFPRRPLIMGILNINDDSFSGDGRLDSAWAMERVCEMTALGADIIDVGAESARTNRGPISEEEEFARLEPILRGFADAVSGAVPRDEKQVFPPLLSVNTWRTGIARRALRIAGDILNDMSTLPDAGHARLCAETGSALLIMHSVGLPKQKHTHVRYGDVVEEVEKFFRDKLVLACEAGLPAARVILDPGIDFAKQKSDNLRLFANLERLVALGRPLLLPVSRKSVIGRTLGLTRPADRDAGTAACIVAGARRGAAIFRVHNVEMAWRCLVTMDSVNMQV